MNAIAKLTLSVQEGSDELPTEFRIFSAGENETTQGVFVFDDDAAAAVMAEYEAHAVDLMIDLEHLSVDDASRNYDPDARGWCKLEVRDGELWAVDVKWTDDGAERLKSKRQRYVSPCFGYDKASKQIKKLLNIAITALPATHGTPELVAARQARDWRKLSDGPSLEDLRRLLQAAIADTYPTPADEYSVGPWVCDVFDASAVYEYDGKLYEVAFAFDGSDVKLGAPVEVRRSYEPIKPPAAPTATARAMLSALSGDQTMDPKVIQQALEAIKNGDSAKALEILEGLIVAEAGGEAPPAEEPPAEMNEDSEEQLAEEPPDEDKEAMAAASMRLLRISGKTTLGGAVEEVETWRQAYLKQASERAKLEKEREALELEERRTLVTTLIKLGAETPATAWAGDAKTRKPCKRLASEPLAELRERTKALLAARGGKLPTEVRPPSGGGGGGAGDLTESELALCKKKGLDPSEYAAMRAAIRERSGGHGSSGGAAA